MKKNKKIVVIALSTLALILALALIWLLPNADERKSVQLSAMTEEPAVSEPTELFSQEKEEPTEISDPAESQTSEAVTEPSQEHTSAEESDTPTTEPTQSEKPTEPEEPTTQATQTEEATESTQPTESEMQDDPQERIDELIAMVYALRDEYTARLYAIEQAGINEYNALPQEEKTSEKKREIALRCVDEAYALEKECDGRIDEICYELGILLLKTDGDMTLINEIRYVYASEKTAAKNELTERYSALLG